MSQQQGGGGAFWGGLLLGGAIGTVVGLLIAPRSGKETRQLLRKSADALPELLEDITASFEQHRNTPLRNHSRALASHIRKAQGSDRRRYRSHPATAANLSA